MQQQCNMSAELGYLSSMDGKADTLHSWKMQGFSCDDM